jgi:long-subunit acyl-CoA synthetase (AMP-forming)
VATIFACPVRQGYGLTETTAITCITHHDDNSTRCVGPPTECSCIRLRDWEEGGYLVEDLHNPDIGKPRGEILVGGPLLCAGYFESPAIPDPDVAEKNKNEFIEVDGVRFFCTGDIGQILPNGNVAIIDRKKDLVKLQHGEYIALSKVENALKDSKYVALPMVYADSHKGFCIAVVCPQVPVYTSLAEQHPSPRTHAE